MCRFGLVDLDLGRVFAAFFFFLSLDFVDLHKSDFDDRATEPSRLRVVFLDRTNADLMDPLLDRVSAGVSDRFELPALFFLTRRPFFPSV